MTKKHVIIAIIVLVLGIIIGYGSSYLISKIILKDKAKENQKEKQNDENKKGDKYFINYFDYTIPGTKFKFELDKNGNYALEVYNDTSTVDAEPTMDNYSGTFTTEQFTNITKILDKIASENESIYNKEYAFYYDNSEDETKVELKSSQIINIEKIVIAIKYIEKGQEGTTNYTEQGNNILKYLVKELEDEEKELKDGYRKIILDDYQVSNYEEIEIKKDEKITYRLENNKIYLNNKELPLEINGIYPDSINIYAYAVDIDEDGKLEIIIRTIDNGISPVSVNHYFYKYINNEFKESVAFSTIGPINEFYVKGKDIKISYEPAEGAPGYKIEDHYTIKNYHK